MSFSINRLILRYFKPKAFELCGPKTVYEYLGIRIYKKYLPSSGDLVSRLRKLRHIDISRTGRIEELTLFERKTRRYEWRHIVGALALVGLSFLLDRKLTLFDWIFLPLLNLYVNIYPIFLQRYNRIRIVNTLKKLGAQSPYDAV